MAKSKDLINPKESRRYTIIHKPDKNTRCFDYAEHVDSANST